MMATPGKDSKAFEEMVGNLKNAVVKEKKKFGKEVKEDFMFAEGYVNANHGSFGALPFPIHLARIQLLHASESRPDLFQLYHYGTLLQNARAAVAELLHTPVANLVFVPNATTGIYTALNNLRYAPGDAIIYFSFAYGSCAKTVLWLQERGGVRAERVQVRMPVEEETLVEELRKAIGRVRARGETPRVAMFDTVVSMPGIRLPFEKMVELCKQEGVLSCVDAAHGAGMLDLNLGELDPDFLVTNMHKWLFTPKPSAAFYVSPRSQHLIRTSFPVSHNFTPRPMGTSGASPRPVPLGDDPDPLPSSFGTGVNPIPRPHSSEPARSYFESLFEFVGTMEASSYLCAPAAIEYRAKVLGGEAAIREYCFSLARRAGDIVTRRLGSRLLENSTGSLGNCACANVALPISLEGLKEWARREKRVGVENGEVGERVKMWLQEKMFGQEVFVPIWWDELNCTWWARLSAQVYLEEGDFVVVAETLESLSKQVMEGAWFSELSGPVKPAKKLTKL